MLLQLPEHILTTIFKQLHLQDIYSLILTCKTLCNIIVNDNILWKSLAKKLLWLSNFDRYNRPKRLIIHTVANNGVQSQSWYNNCRASYNWCKGFYQSKVILKHKMNYMPWMKLHNSEVLLITVGTQLYCYEVDGLPNCKHLLWKIEVPQVARNDIRTNDITRFVLNEDLLICGNRDGSSALYKVDNIRCKPQLIQHIKDCHENGAVEVTAVELVRNNNDYYFVTASSDSSIIKFWSQNIDNECRGDQQNYKNHIGVTLNDGLNARCLAVNEKGDKLAVGGNGSITPLLIDGITGQHLVTVHFHDILEAIRDIQWHDENSVIYVTRSGLVHLYDIRNNTVVYTAADPFLSTLYCVKTDKRRAFIVGSAEHSRCVLFDYCSPLHIQMYYTQKRSSPVYSLDFNTSTLLAAVDRGISALNFDISATTTSQQDYADIIFQSRGRR